MEIRRITRQDLPALTELFKRSVFEIAGRDYTPAQCAAWTLNAENPQWAERFLSTWTIGAFIADQLVGFANLKSPTQLDCFYVHPDFQRRRRFRPIQGCERAGAKGESRFFGK